MIDKLIAIPKPTSPRDRLLHADPCIDENPLAKQAERWVAQTFFGTLLKQARNSPFKSELFSGGRGAEAFGPIFDANVIDRIAHKVGGKLSRAIVNKLEAAKAYENAQSATTRESSGPRA